MVLDPNIIFSSKFALSLSSIDHTTRFDEHHFALMFCLGLVSDALGYNAHLSGFQRHGVVFKFNFHFSIDNQEQFVGFGMIMPDKFSLDFDQLDLVVIQLFHNFRRPLLNYAILGNCDVQQPQFGGNGYCSSKQYFVCYRQ